MRQLNYIKAATLEWHDVPSPELSSPEAALVRPLVVSTCDMDGVVISGLARLKGPVAVGHEGVAVVLDVGESVGSVRPGDRVIVPWKISCGKCEKCRLGFTAHCRAVPREAAYSWGPTAREYGGFLSDEVLVPFADHMLVPLPPELDPGLASGLSDNIVDAWRAVGPPLARRPGGSVAIAGGGGPGSIGLMACGLAGASGAGEVLYMDWSADRRAVAERWGALTIDTSDSLPERLAHRDFDVTVDASGNPAALALVARHTGDNGICTSTAGAIYALGDVPMPVFHLYRRSAEFHTGWVHTRALIDEPLRLLREGRFDPAPVVTRTLPFSEAADALVEPFTKLIFERDPEPAERAAG